MNKTLILFGILYPWLSPNITNNNNTNDSYTIPRGGIKHLVASTSTSCFILFSFLLILTFTTIVVPTNSFGASFKNTPEDSIINCSPISFVCDGTDKKDIIIGTSVNDNISSFDGNDIIQGSLLTDKIFGGKGDDTIQGGEGSDVIFGQGGNDFLFTDSPKSAIGTIIGQGEPNSEDSRSIVFRLIDIASQILNNSELITLFDKHSPGINIKFDDFKNEFGKKINRNLINTNEDNSMSDKLFGGEGDDHLFGGSGNDILIGGQGKDFFDCNEGQDTVLDYDSKEDTLNISCEEI